VGHYQTQLFLITPPKKLFFSLAGEWENNNNVELTRFDGGVCTPVFAQKVANFPNGLLNDFRLPRRPLMVRAALLQRTCDGVAAATEMRRPAPSRSFCASRLDATR